MGHKNVKEHYRIGHSVHITKAGICIGSPYVSDLIVIGLDGTIKKAYQDRGNEDLIRYQREMLADPSKLRELIAAPDTFTASLPVYTYDGAEIITDYCEKYGWPNVTHSGRLMYENTFSSDKSAIVAHARRNAQLGIEAWAKNLEEAEQRVAKCRELLAEEKRILDKLNAEYP